MQKRAQLSLCIVAFQMRYAEACITDRIRISLDDPQEMSEVVPFKNIMLLDPALQL
jgi:hypothetical protein